VPSLQRSFTGKVARFSGHLSLTTRTMETEVDVPNPGLVLVPGMYAEVALTTDRRTQTLAIPLEAVANPETAPSVMVVNAGKLEDRPVKLGLETAHRVEVLSGLADGDLVLVGSRSQFRPGQAVEPKILAAQAKEDR
jgi:multidrug efflux pump subunit AcrA (membrane-fusion protein)